MRNIVVLSDGTGNGAAKRHGTNVRRLYDALDLHRPDQLAFYDDGVGSQEFLPLKLLGGVFGYGLKRNVLQMYAFLCRAYQEAGENGNPDRIYLFGFSRGAFTVRVLAGMLAHCGLYTAFDDERDLARVTRHNYRAFLSRFERGWAYQVYRRLKGTSDQAKGDCHPDIEVIGVWDTVDAYGLPIDELAIIWDRFVYPIRFPDHDLARNVKRALHAVSVDDERLTFHPLLWNEGGAVQHGGEDNPEIEQVWFPGVHSDVGGGYPESELALLSLDWMMGKVEATAANGRGLHFIPGARGRIKAHSDWHGKQHDSRSGLAAYYRYKPRDVESLCNDPRGLVSIAQAKIHRSVLERIRGGFSGYAPTGLPERYTMVVSDGTPPVYESTEERRNRREAMNGALDVVFWRRWLYGALLVATVALLASRFFLPYQEGGACDGSACLVDPVLSAVQSLLPGIAGGWFEALRQNASWLWGFLLAFLVLFRIKAMLLAAAVAIDAHVPVPRRRALQAADQGEMGPCGGDLLRASRIARGGVGPFGDARKGRTGSDVRGDAVGHLDSDATRDHRHLEPLRRNRHPPREGGAVPNRRRCRSVARRRSDGNAGGNGVGAVLPRRLRTVAAAHRRALDAANGPHRRRRRRHLHRRQRPRRAPGQDGGGAVPVRKRCGLRASTRRLVGAPLPLGPREQPRCRGGRRDAARSAYPWAAGAPVNGMRRGRSKARSAGCCGTLLAGSKPRKHKRIYRAPASAAKRSQRGPPLRARMVLSSASWNAAINAAVDTPIITTPLMASNGPRSLRSGDMTMSP